MLVYCENFVGYGASWSYREQGVWWYIERIVWVIERVKCTESRHMVVCREICVGYRASWRYREQGVLWYIERIVWVMERVDGTESSVFFWYILWIVWIMERVESTESRVYSCIYSKFCALWSELMVQGAGRILVYRENCVGYGASWS